MFEPLGAVCVVGVVLVFLCKLACDGRCWRWSYFLSRKWVPSFPVVGVKKMSKSSIRSLPHPVEWRPRVRVAAVSALQN